MTKRQLWIELDLFIASSQRIKASERKMSLQYASLYSLHDDMLTKKRKEIAQLREREEKRQRLAGQYEELCELPALSSFVHIEEAAEEASAGDSADPQDQQQLSANGRVVRDGFERIRRSEWSYAHTHTHAQDLKTKNTQVQDGSGRAGPGWLEAVLPPEAVPRGLHCSVCSPVLEAGPAWVICKSPPEDPGRQQLGQPCPGDPDLHAQEVGLPCQCLHYVLTSILCPFCT